MTHTLTEALSQFTGSETVYRHPLFASCVYTEGVRYLAQEAGAYWLIEYVFSNQLDKTIHSHPFQAWSITVHDDHTAKIRLTDGNDTLIKSFVLTFTDFPLKAFTLWFIDGTLLLPSEY